MTVGSKSDGNVLAAADWNKIDTEKTELHKAVLSQDATEYSRNGTGWGEVKTYTFTPADTSENIPILIKVSAEMKVEAGSGSGSAGIYLGGKQIIGGEGNAGSFTTASTTYVVVTNTFLVAHNNATFNDLVNAGAGVDAASYVVSLRLANGTGAKDTFIKNINITIYYLNTWKASGTIS